MKIDIWSDIRCPFCYIGKHKFERALERFAHKDKVEVIWHSFQLDPQLKTDAAMNAYDYLAKIKGMTREESVRLHAHVTTIAREAGLTFHFDKTVVANSFNAHRLIQFAKTRAIAGAAEEELFKAHFTEGKNIDDAETLIEIGAGIGLPKAEVEEVVASSAFADEVKLDETMARSIGIRGVPFFVLNEQSALSGAQAPEVFLQALEKTWKEKETAVG